MPARSLPDRPNLSQYRKQAKELAQAARTGDAVALARMKAHHPRADAFVQPDAPAPVFALADAQLVIAREHGIDSWPKFVKAIEGRAGAGSPARVWALADRAVIAGDVPALERLLLDHGPVLKAGPPRGSSFVALTPDLSAGDARSIIAANHQFATWNDFEGFTRELRDKASPTAQFEAAVDAVVAGDETTLDRLLRLHPELIAARSKRTHRSTLLLYVGANGIEGFRQRTPKNAVSIARRLLDAGADVDAVGEMYRGTTTLGLVATSVHPVTSGVQAELIDVLVKAGASLARAVAPDYTHGRVVNACLANGRGEGALLVAERGADLDLEGAAGVGRLDVVKNFVDERGRLAPGVAREQLLRGCAWACQYGRRAVVEFLLDRGVDPGESRDNETMLHNAALGGHPDIVRLLIAHGAPIDVRDDHYQATPLGWALHGWGNRRDDRAAAAYYDVVRQLVAAGARVMDAWLADEQVSADPQLMAALTHARPS